MKLAELKSEFPRGAVSWRAQTLTKAGDKALALAYIDARDVMDRLDQVCSEAGWQDSYAETAKGRIICTISVFIGDQWVSKSDGAGNTDVEGDKGAISDAFKRAAVKWGIGRYLYDIKAPWVPCETTEYNGKKRWKKWSDDPWRYVRDTSPPANDKPPFDPAGARDRIKAKIEKARTMPALQEAWVDNQETLALIREQKPAMYAELEGAKDKRKAAMMPPDPAGQSPQGYGAEQYQ